MKERDVVLQGQENGQPTIDYPVTRLELVEGAENVLRTGDRGKAGGVASLDESGRVPESQLPSLAPFAAGTSAPEDKTRLWIDTTANTGGLKYWNGSAWVHVPVAYT